MESGDNLLDFSETGNYLLSSSPTNPNAQTVPPSSSSPQPTSEALVSESVGSGSDSPAPPPLPSVVAFTDTGSLLIDSHRSDPLDFEQDFDQDDPVLLQSSPPPVTSSPDIFDPLQPVEEDFVPVPPPQRQDSVSYSPIPKQEEEPVRQSSPAVHREPTPPPREPSPPPTPPVVVKAAPPLAPSSPPRTVAPLSSPPVAPPPVPGSVTKQQTTPDIQDPTPPSPPKPEPVKAAPAPPTPVSQKPSSSSSSSSGVSASKTANMPSGASLSSLLGPKFTSTVSDLVYWRDPRRSGPVFGLGLVVLLSLSYCSVISVIAYLLLTALTGTFSFRVYKTVIGAVQKTNEPPPFKDLLDVDITPSADKVHQAVDILLGYYNSTATELRRVFLIEDFLDSIKYGLLFWLLTYIGSWFNGLTLLILAWLVAFGAPKVYEMHKATIDQYINLAMTHIKTVVTLVRAKVPFLAKKEKDN